MHHAKAAILKSFRLVVTLLGRTALLALLAVMTAEGLAFVEHLDKYALLENFFLVERYVEKPVTDLLHANVPCVFAGVDVAPYMIAVALLVLWVVCESERYRLRVQAWRLEEERKIALAGKTAALAEKKLAAEREERAIARAERDSRLRADMAADRNAAARLVAEAEAARAAAETERLSALAAQAAAAAPRPAPAPAPAAGDVSQREQLLELYAQTKKSLEEQKKNLSFLAIDVVDSTGMKLGEDSALAERDFRQYKKLVERVIAAHKGLKAAWTPDGVMICFASVQNAVQAAQDLIRGLDHFNRSVKTIKADFKVRCGINAGNVLFDESVKMEEMTDRNIDIAGHMQKYAQANTIYVGAHAIEGIRAHGFRPAQKQVDGHEVYEWRAEGLAESAA